MEANEPEGVDLRDLQDLNDDLLAELSPALRAAIERVYSPDALEGPGGFNSFVDADL
ncbi:hypothetical protein [Paractinoplanes brasiliensis]|uniref:Uncharacterized protein n=1 Tax=Paractinoplanes brasiliensis TaxID=52695 RepID=A0A4R6K2N7_9ACTN|nr:hypothetical protein [Actinoplanes brasiliensis]TDO42421.1 hypothetical protein C8E87_6192 [Actinoplanes brasiliensis]GID29655.1 hypothetical protein Abr02nite_46380 [Actinoplanes brasiliensis]